MNMKKWIVFISMILCCLNSSSQDYQEIKAEKQVGNQEFKKIDFNSENKDNIQLAHNDRYITFGVNMNISEPLLKEYKNGRVYLGYEFNPKKSLPINLEFRAALFFDSYTDSNWMFENNYFSFFMITPTAMVVPKFVYEINDNFSFLLDSELSFGLPVGKANYGGNSSLKITKRNMIVAYGCNIGMRVHTEEFNASFTIGYTTFDIYNTIKRNKPVYYNQSIPHPHSEINVSAAFLLPF
jgi:hypothetical protein